MLFLAHLVAAGFLLFLTLLLLCYVYVQNNLNVASGYCSPFCSLFVVCFYLFISQDNSTVSNPNIMILILYSTCTHWTVARDFFMNLSLVSTKPTPVCYRHQRHQLVRDSKCEHLQDFQMVDFLN
jgi:hypothetical protein